MTIDQNTPPPLVTDVSPDRRPTSRTLRRVRDVGRQAGALVALVVVMIIFGLLNDRFLTPENMRAILDVAAVPAIVAIGATFVILTGRIDLSVEGVMATCSMTLAMLIANNRTDINIGGWGIVITVLVGCLFGVVSSLLHVRFRVPSFLVTLGMWFIGLGLATVMFNGVTPTIADPDLLALVNGRVFGIPNSAIVALLCTIIGSLILRFTKFGRSVRAIGGDERLSILNGYPNVSTKIGVFVIAGICSALASSVATVQVGVGAVNIGTGTGALFAGITAVVIGGTALSGGRGGVWRSLVGALLIAAISNGLILMGVTPDIQDIVRGVIIVVGVSAVAWSQRSRLKVVK